MSGGGPKALPFEETGPLPPLKDMLSKKRPRINKPKLKAEIEEYVSQNPGQYDTKLIAKMKKVGMKRPDWIPGEAWSPPQRGMEPMQSVICYMAAWGMKPGEIGRNVGLSGNTVIDFLAKETSKAEVRAIQDRIWGQDPKKWLQSLIPDAIRTVVEVMNDKSAKQQTRLNAAADVLDRSLGKAKQELEVTDGNMRSVLEKLDRIEKIKSGVTLPQENTDEPIEAEFVEVKDDEPKDTVDRWIEENLCQESSDGKNPS